MQLCEAHTNILLCPKSHLTFLCIKCFPDVTDNTLGTLYSIGPLSA